MSLFSLLLFVVSLPAEEGGQVLLGPRFGVKIGPKGFGTHIEVSYRLQEVPITTAFSGRVNAVAINPLNTSKVLVTSESGGLFESVNGGVDWTHVDGLPPHEVRDVAYLSDPRFVLVTAFDDFRRPSGAGVWRSDPRGEWRQPPTSVLPVGGRCGGRPTGSGIAIEPGTGRIYVATSCGILISADNGETWRLVDRPLPGRGSDWSPAVFNSVAALGAGKVIIAGPAGVWYSSDSGNTWSREDSFSLSLGEGEDGEQTVHGLSASPVSGEQAYLVTGTSAAHKVWFTTTAGRHWQQIPSAPAGGDACGGNPFIKAGLVPGTGDIDIYYGENCSLHKLRAMREPGPTPSFRYDGTWAVFTQDHSDARDVALQDGARLFLANDGGLEKWNEADSRFYSTGGGNHGLNALQLMVVTGQKIRSGAERHLYVGSQDNGMWATADSGRTWYNGGIEGAIIQLDREVERVADSRVFWTDSGGGGGSFLGGALFAEPRTPWRSCPNPRKDPILISRGTYIQAGYREPIFEKWLTRNFGESWEGPLELLNEGEDYVALAGPADDPVLYQAIGYPHSEKVGLVRLSHALTVPDFRRTGVDEMDMRGFGGLGLNATMWIWYNPFAVDPGEPDHLIAPDAMWGDMKESVNGGVSWRKMPGLTRLLTREGSLRFTRLRNTRAVPGSWIPVASEISFHPDHPEYVLLGTANGGLYFSSERGRDGTWSKIPGSDQVKPVTTFYWESPTSAYISTYGRGLWHFEIAMRTIVDDPDDLVLFEWCPLPCFRDLRAGPPPDDRPIDEGLLVVDGSVYDAVIENGRLKSFAVSPGSMAISFVSKQTGRSNIMPAYTNKTGEFAGLPQAAELIRKGKVIRGFTFENGLVKHVVYGDTIVKLEISPRNPSKITIRKGPGADNLPYISVQGEKMMGSRPVLDGPGELVVLGRNFGRGRNNPIEIRVDNKVVAQGIFTDEQGRFRAVIKVDAEMGAHGVQVFQQLAKGKTLRGARIFVVNPSE